MRILHVTPFYEPAWAHGGMARSSAALCRALVRRGHDVRVATALLDPSSPLLETRDAVRVHRFPGPAALKQFLVPWAIGLHEFLRSELPTVDVVHLHGHRNGLAVTASRALRAAGRPWVLSTHGTFPHHGQYPFLKQLFDGVVGSAIVEGAAELVAVSQCEARDLPRVARVIPNGVEACAAPALGQRKPGRMLFVGTGRPQKRGQLLPQLLRALPGAELQLVGRFGKRFLDMFASFPDRVTASGILAGDALATAYASASVVVHPAVGEAFGLVPFEAALAGTAAVVAGGHGCGEWFGRAGGCVVPPDDVVALGEAVAARLHEGDLGRGEARAVERFAREHLTWDESARATESVYLDVTERRR